MIEDCKGVDKSINEVVLVPELAALLQSQACRLGGGGGGGGVGGSVGSVEPPRPSKLVPLAQAGSAFPD